MYKTVSNKQITLFDFNQSCGIQLNPENEWIQLADRINWADLETEYAKMFPSHTGCPAKPLRMALGSLIVQKRKNLSDRALVREIAENPYIQYFLGLDSFSATCPFTAPALVSFRKRLTLEFINIANESWLDEAGSTAEHSDENESKRAKDAKNQDTDSENFGTAILDATCSPSNIRYPQDFSLLNEARENLEKMIDDIHKTYHPWKKPRDYRRTARQDYLTLAKTKKRSAKKVRATVRKMLGYVRRDLRYIEEYLTAGYVFDMKYVDRYLTILKLYEQQKYMYDNRVRRVENRIVSISQPYVRPIVRGKAKSPTEFGAKYDVSIDEKGHARLEHISFDPYNENTIFQDVIERYYRRNGHYPKRALVDQIYRTKANRQYCKARGIELSGPKLGRPAKDSGVSKKAEYQDNTDRIEVERFFSREKRSFGAGLIMTKLEETSLASIALSVYVANLFGTPLPTFFCLYLLDTSEDVKKAYFIELESDLVS